jgi:hypothetical protein
MKSVIMLLLLLMMRNIILYADFTELSISEKITTLKRNQQNCFLYQEYIANNAQSAIAFIKIRYRSFIESTFTKSYKNIDC